MRYQCKCGNESKISFESFKQGSRCRNCYSDRNKGSKHYRWNPDRDAVKKRKFYRSRSTHLLNHSLHALGWKKNAVTTKLLGYTPAELRKHIETHVNWSQVKDKKWVIDHIFPIVAFIDYNVLDLKHINNLDNLQPLTAKDNRRKWHFYDKHVFEKYLQKKNINFMSLA